jgi:hypothetical protein
MCWSLLNGVLSIRPILGIHTNLTKQWKQHTVGCVRISSCSVCWTEQPHRAAMFVKSIGGKMGLGVMRYPIIPCTFPVLPYDIFTGVLAP